MDLFPDVVEHADGGSRVEISTLFEGLDHPLAIGQVGQHSQFKLAVVGHDQFVALLDSES